MNNKIWDLFLQTGNVEAYLLLKHLENENEDQMIQTELENEENVSFQTKM